MNDSIAELKIPPEFDNCLREFVQGFPANVRYDKESRNAEVVTPMSFELKVAMAYVAFVTEFDAVTDNLNLVLGDIMSLATAPPFDAKEGERRYFLLTRVFFYELLRIRDAFPRFLKRMEEEGLLTRQQRRESRKLIEDKLEEHYLIRNTYLHGHTMPKSDAEIDLSLMRSAWEAGYHPELVPLDGSEKKSYPDFLVTLATRRHKVLHDLADEYVVFFQTILNTTAIWTAADRFTAKPGT